MSTLKNNWKNPFEVLDWSKDRFDALWIPLMALSAIARARKRVTRHIFYLNRSSVSTIVTLITVRSSYTGIF
jgi:hypothetical protein